LDQAPFEETDQESLEPICWSFVIGEAVKALPKDLLDRHPAVDWKGFARFRDVLAHQYFRIQPTLLWKAISVSLLPLDAAVSAEPAGIATTTGENSGRGPPGLRSTVAQSRGQIASRISVSQPSAAVASSPGSGS